MTEFALGVLVGVVCLYFALKIAANLFIKRLQHQLEMLDKEIADMHSNNIMARVEEDNGVFYIYNTEDNSFIAQGRTMQEIRTAIDSMGTGWLVRVVDGDSAVIEKLEKTQGNLSV